MSFSKGPRVKLPEIVGPQVDVSRLPKDLREARADTVPHRPGEVRARIHMTLQRSLAYPNGRLWVAHEPAKIDHYGNVDQKEMVVMKCLDRRGVETLSQAQIEYKDLPVLIREFITLYRASGATQTEIASLAEEPVVNDE